MAKFCSLRIIFLDKDAHGTQRLGDFAIFLLPLAKRVSFHKIRIYVGYLICFTTTQLPIATKTPFWKNREEFLVCRTNLLGTYQTFITVIPIGARIWASWGSGLLLF